MTRGRSRAAGAAFALALLACAGCHQLAPYSSQTPPDGAVDGARDGGRDGVDLAVPDADTRDAAAPDAAVDATPEADAPADAVVAPDAPLTPAPLVPTAASNPLGDVVGFGDAVALGGGWAAVGAPGPSAQDTGRVETYEQVGGAWTWRSRINGSGDADGGQFGEAVVFVNGALAVGGRALGVEIFTRSAGAWTKSDKLSSNVSRFGNRLAASGNRLVVSAMDEIVAGHGSAGAVYVYTVDGQGKAALEERIEFSAPAQSMYFGQRTAIDGQRLVVSSAAKRVWAYALIGGAWIADGELIPAQAAADEVDFGKQIAISGKRAVVGAPLHDEGQAINSGAAFVFERVGGAWQEVAKVLAPGSPQNLRFGTTVALEGDKLVVGAPKPAVDLKPGQVFCYQRFASGGWVATHEITGQPGDVMGFESALQGATVLIGSEYADGARGKVWFAEVPGW